MNKHFSSKAHDICVKKLHNRKNEAITKCVDAMNENQIASTCTLFNMVYSLTKRSRPFYDSNSSLVKKWSRCEY